MLTELGGAVQQLIMKGTTGVVKDVAAYSTLAAVVAALAWPYSAETSWTPNANKYRMPPKMIHINADWLIGWLID